jgi:hypothetical protein
MLNWGRWTNFARAVIEQLISDRQAVDVARSFAELNLNLHERVRLVDIETNRPGAD